MIIKDEAFIIANQGRVALQGGGVSASNFSFINIDSSSEMFVNNGNGVQKNRQLSSYIASPLLACVSPLVFVE